MRDTHQGSKRVTAGPPILAEREIEGSGDVPAGAWVESADAVAEYQDPRLTRGDAVETAPQRAKERAPSLVACAEDSGSTAPGRTEARLAPVPPAARGAGARPACGASARPARGAPARATTGPRSNFRHRAHDVSNGAAKDAAATTSAAATAAAAGASAARARQRRQGGR
jgi:hypothetical protein